MSALLDHLVPAISLQAKLGGCVFRSLGMLVAVVANISVAVEAQWDAVLVCIRPTILRLNYVMALHFDTTKLVADTAPPATGDHRLFFYRGRPHRMSNSMLGTKPLCPNRMMSA
jgi:hypothetical protein